MMSLIRGDRFRNTLTGQIFEVKLVGDRMIVLESEDKSNQVLTLRGNLNLFYERIGNGIEPRVAS